MAVIDEILELGNLAVNAYDSYSRNKLAQSTADANRRDKYAYAEFQDDLVTKRAEDERVYRSLLKIDDENKAELLRLDKIADDLDFDFNFDTTQIGVA